MPCVLKKRSANYLTPSNTVCVTTTSHKIKTKIMENKRSDAFIIDFFIKLTSQSILNFSHVLIHFVLPNYGKHIRIQRWILLRYLSSQKHQRLKFQNSTSQRLASKIIDSAFIDAFIRHGDDKPSRNFCI